MQEILFPVLLLAGIGLVLGLGLAIASVVFAVPKNEKAEKIEEILPGANCGACGFSGCSGYALALAKGEAKPGLCSVGGDEVAQKSAEILGVEAEATVKKTAVVYCMGNNTNTHEKMEYQGIKTCKDAIQINGGVNSCGFGCIGFGDCMNVCEYGAINICDGLASVNPDKCRACGKCTAVCPKSLIRIVPVKKQALVLCSSCDKGPDVKKACSAGCMGCSLCVKNCPVGAIKLDKFHAIVDPEKCIGCGKCVTVCKFNCITLVN